ncbi:DUF5633 domain-containing protein [Hutsoniella sourekii]|uniref:DUF5633 domain-containing protein n=1 Tax=Hutsoniella sourekii TaxID=87650 RepID=UPI0004843CEF|nr:DUF5633 domain-containing protein [Hutsoniella sourekii]
MKKKFLKLTTLSLASSILVGVAPIAAIAADTTTDTTQNETVDQVLAEAKEKAISEIEGIFGPSQEEKDNFIAQIKAATTQEDIDQILGTVRATYASGGSTQAQSAESSKTEVTSDESTDQSADKVEAEEENNEDGYSTLQAAITAADAALAADVTGLANGYQIVYNSNSKTYSYLLNQSGKKIVPLTELTPAAEESSESSSESQSSESASSTSNPVVDESTDESSQSTSSESVSSESGSSSADETEKGFKTEAEAKAAAEKALKSDKVNKGYVLSQNPNNKLWYYSLTTEKQAETRPAPQVKDDKKESQPAEKEFDADKGYATKEDAIKAAEAIIKKSDINKGYNIAKGTDGKWYIQLTIEPNKVVDGKHIDNQDANDTTKEVALAFAKQLYEGEAVVSGTAPVNSTVTINVEDRRAQEAGNKVYAAGAYTAQANKDGYFSSNTEVLKAGQVVTISANGKSVSQIVQAVKPAQKGLPNTGESTTYGMLGAALVSILAGLGIALPQYKRN